MALKEAQRTHSQHAVPQNIMDVEFKLIGDLTMRQFTYLLVFGLTGYIFSITLVGFFKLPLSLGSILIGLALAFVPIRERGMDEWIVNFIKAVYGPTHFLWKKQAVLPTAFKYQSLNVVRQELITLAPTSSRRKLEEYLELQDGGPAEDSLDIPEEEYLMKVKDAFKDVAVSSPPIADQSQASTESAGFQAFNPQQQVAQPHMQEASAPTPTPPAPSPQEGVQIPAPTAPADVPSEASEIKETPVEEPKAPVTQGPKPVTPKPTPKPKPKPKVTAKPVKRTYPHASFVEPINQDRHVGRRFTNLLPSEGQLILPVRGEMVLQTSEQIDIEEDIGKRTEQLRGLLDQIKGDETFKGIVAAGPNIPQDDSSKQKIVEAEGVVEKVKVENEKLTEEISKLKEELGTSKETEEQKKKKQELISKLEKEKNQASDDYSALQKQVLELQQRLKEKENAGADKGPKKKEASFAKMKALTNDPNIVSGVLKNAEGEPLEGSVLLIKNNKGEAVRAVKTNSIGQFSISTALVNGMYTIEIGTAVDGQTFDIITVEVKGEVIPPIEITGRPV